MSKGKPILPSARGQSKRSIEMRNPNWLLSFAGLMFTSPVEAFSGGAVAENQNGTIAGRVRYDGKRPARKVLNVTLLLSGVQIGVSSSSASNVNRRKVPRANS